MLQEVFKQFCETLSKADDNFISVDVEIVETREKAVLVESMTGTHAKRQWLPKSQLAALDRGKVFGFGLAVKRSWIARQKLWWMT